MKFSKYNNPNKRKHYKKPISRIDADVIASKALFDDMQSGRALPLSDYDKMSDDLCGKTSRRIYENV